MLPKVIQPPLGRLGSLIQVLMMVARAIARPEKANDFVRDMKKPLFRIYFANSTGRLRNEIVHLSLIIT